MVQLQGNSRGLLLESSLGSFSLLLCAICFLPLKCYSFFFLYDFVLLGAFFCILPFIIFRTGRIFLTLEHLIFAVIGLWAVVTYLHSVNPKSFGISWYMYIMPGVLFLFLTQLMNGDRRSFTNGIMVVGSLISLQLIISMLFLVIRSGGAFDLHMSANVYWARSNYIAALLELPILWLYDRIENKDTRSPAGIVVFSLCFLALILTASRGGILTIVISMVLYTVLKGKRISKPFIYLMVFSCVYVFLSKSIMHRFLHMMDLSNIFRVYLWLQSIELIIKEPLFGYGPGNVMLWSNFFDSIHKMPGPHNIVLEVMLHIGVTGFLMCAALFILLTRRAFLFYKKDRNPVYLILIFASLAHSMVEPTFYGYQYGFIFWFFMSFLVIESTALKKAHV